MNPLEVVIGLFEGILKLLEWLTISKKKKTQPDPPERSPKTHKTSVNMCDPLDPKGMKVKFMGWDGNHGSWRVGDFIIFRLRDGKETRYKVLEIHHYNDPPDMYRLIGEFSPRQVYP